MSGIEISTYLNAPPEPVAQHVRRSQLLEYVAKGVLAFKPIDPPALPEVWTNGEYRVGMYWKGGPADRLADRRHRNPG